MDSLNPPPFIMVIDDDPGIRAALCSQLKLLKSRVTACESAEQALVSSDLTKVECLIVDLQLGGMNGLELLEALRDRQLSQPVVILTGKGSVHQAVAAMKRGAYDFLEKPFEMGILEHTLKRAIEWYRLGQEKQHLEERLFDLVEGEHSFQGLIGRSPAMYKVIQQLSSFADAASPVLIVGETGTGKELAAQALHHLSLRRTHPFIAMNMGGLPENLIDSELFGHVKGAFTGAIDARQGCFEQVGQGTVFLDEIAELPIAAQGKLLRVLEAGEFRRIGSEKALKSRARILAATNRSLEDWIKQGRFREDLYYRLNVLRIDMPALRDHTEDIPLLAAHFLEHYSEIYGKQIPSLTTSALTALCHYSWPGNVRELRYEMERLVVSGPGRISSWKSHGTVTEQPGLDLRTKLENLERQEILKALAATGENVNQASRLLGIPRTVLYDRIRRLQILLERSSPGPKTKSNGRTPARAP